MLDARQSKCIAVSALNYSSYKCACSIYTVWTGVGLSLRSLHFIAVYLIELYSYLPGWTLLCVLSCLLCCPSSNLSKAQEIGFCQCGESKYLYVTLSAIGAWEW